MKIRGQSARANYNLRIIYVMLYYIPEFLMRKTISFLTFVRLVFVRTFIGWKMENVSDSELWTRHSTKFKIYNNFWFLKNQ